MTKNPKMLFVDDRTKRIHYALDNFGKDYEVTIATCVPEALRQMSSQDWDVISLDHDLDGHDFQDPDTPTCGMEIMRYIAKTGWPPQRKKPDFWIHSSNLFAAHLMTVALTEAGHNAWYKPIIYIVEHMKYDKEGIPINKFPLAKFWEEDNFALCRRCGKDTGLNSDNICNGCWTNMIMTGKNP